MAGIVITDISDARVRKVKDYNHPLAKFIFKPRKTKATSILPFRVKFTTVGIEGYDSRNPAPIGIAVIGVNNYIL
jgi:hypothetical protein